MFCDTLDRSIDWHETSGRELLRGCDSISELDVWVTSGDANHVFIKAVVFLDVSLSVPIVKGILPNSVV